MTGVQTCALPICFPVTIQGYPARSVNTLLWASPLGAEVAPGIERLSEMLDKWEILKGRLQVIKSEALDSIMVGEMSRANMLSKTEVREWLGTDAAWGGGTLVPTEATVTVTASEPEKLPTLKFAAGIASEVEQCNLLAFPITFIEAARVWSQRVKWRKLEYTKAKRKRVKMRTNIPIKGAKAPEPPDIPFWERFFGA